MEERNWCGNTRWPLIVNNQILDLGSPSDSGFENYYRRYHYGRYVEESERSSNNSGESTATESGSESEEEDSQTNDSAVSAEEDEKEEESAGTSSKKPAEEEEQSEVSEEDDNESESGSQREMEYFDLHVIQKDPYSQVFLHIKQITNPDSPNTNHDVFFPLNQAEEVADSVKELCQVVVPEDKNPKYFSFLQNGVTTTHVELWLEYSPEFKAYSIFFRCLINNAVVAFPKDVHGDKCYNRIEWFRKMYSSGSTSLNYDDQF